MPKTIQTGESVTLADLRVEAVNFSWTMQPGALPTDPPREVFHRLVTYCRVKDDGSVHDRVIREVTPSAALINSLESYRSNQRTAQRTAEGI